MEENNNEIRAARAYQSQGHRGGGSGVVIFLAVLAVLLALGGALLLRQLLSARYEAQLTAIEIKKVSDEKELLIEQLDELDARYTELSSKYQELEAQFAAERRKVSQLRAQLRGDAAVSGEFPNIAEYRERIEELELQLEAYTRQIEEMEAENLALSSENAQIRATLAQTSARNQLLETQTQELEEKVEKASLLTISNLEATALRERRRGDEPTDKARRADKLRICFTINQNLVAEPGNRDFFIRLINPLNQVLTTSPDNTIEFEGETIQYTLKRTTNFQNNSQEVCVMWNQDERFNKGYYNVVVFHEGREVGYKLFQLD
jgi:phage shock protein A